jgi:hypothetical protein
MTKIFNISLQRTGTQSVHNFLTKSGINSMHWVGHYGIDQYQKFNDKEDLIKKISFLDNKFEAFSDMPYNILYDHYFQKYPDAKFIFVTRDFDSWHKSIENFYQYEKFQKLVDGKKGLTDFQKICYGEYLTVEFSNKDYLSKEEYYEYYSKHYESVYKYFKNSKNFLSVSLFNENLSQEILNFLNINSTLKINNVDFLKQFYRNTKNE